MNRAATLALVIVILASGCAPDPLPHPAKTAASHAPVAASSWVPPERTPEDELSPLAFERYSETRAGDMRRCWAGTTADDPRLQRELTARLTVLPTGQIEDVEVASAAPSRDDLASCIAGVLRTWRTPFRPTEPVWIEVPISLAPAR